MCFVNCSDDDTPDDPADTITLNMLNEHNGKTYLGESKTYINEANNFVTSSNFISDVVFITIEQPKLIRNIRV